MADPIIETSQLLNVRTQVKEATNIIPQAETASQVLAREVAATRKEFERAKAEKGDFYTKLGEGVLMLNEPVSTEYYGTSFYSIVMLTPDGLLECARGVGNPNQTKDADVLSAGVKMKARLLSAQTVTCTRDPKGKIGLSLRFDRDMVDHFETLNQPKDETVQQAIAKSIKKAQEPHNARINQATAAVRTLGVARGALQSQGIK